jgi:hypothetical protein
MDLEESDAVDAGESGPVEDRECSERACIGIGMEGGAEGRAECGGDEWS